MKCARGCGRSTFSPKTLVCRRCRENARNHQRYVRCRCRCSCNRYVTVEEITAGIRQCDRCREQPKPNCGARARIYVGHAYRDLPAAVIESMLAAGDAARRRQKWGQS